MNRKTWNNFDNRLYYEDVSFEKQYGFSKIGGLDVHSDLEILTPHIEKSHSILEVGACYGRVLEFLIKNNYHGKITAIERSKKFFKLLTDNYRTDATLVNSDIKHFITKERYDLILWVWCGISDFSPKEQPKIIKILFELLNKNGLLVIDTIDTAVAPINVSCTNSDTQNYTLDIGKSILSGYIPSIEDMSDYANNMNIKLTAKKYLTSKNRPRIFYFLKKSNLPSLETEDDFSYSDVERVEL
jgi:SAM-dependent methyltransferase